MTSRSSRWLPFAGIGALVVLNVVLIALLVTRPGAPSLDAGEPTETAEAAAPTGEGDATEPTKQEPGDLVETDAPAGLGRSERLLVNLDATTAWRAAVGSCTEPSTLEHSVDGGQTWEELPIELAPVSRVRVLGPQTLFAIGGGTDCRPTYLSSSTGGTSWATNNQFLEGSWYLVPNAPATMGTPVGVVGTPCEAVELAALDASNGAVLCADGSLTLTVDGGASWSAVAPELRARALGVADGGYVVAGTSEACEEAVAATLISAAGDAGGQPACSDVASHDGQQIAVSAAGGAIWVWAGDDVSVLPAA